MNFVANQDGSFTVTLTPDEQAGLAAIGKVRKQPGGDVLAAAASQLTTILTQTVAGIRAETLRELYKRLDAMATDKLVGLLDTVPAVN